MREIIFLIILCVTYAFALDTTTLSQTDKAISVTKLKKDTVSPELVSDQIKAVKDSTVLISDSIRTLFNTKGKAIVEGIKDDQKHKDRVRDKILLLSEKLDTLSPAVKDTTEIIILQKVLLADTATRPIVINATFHTAQAPKVNWLRRLFKK